MKEANKNQGRDGSEDKKHNIQHKSSTKAKNIQPNHFEQKLHKVKSFSTSFYHPLPLLKKLNAHRLLSLDIDVDKIRYLIVKKYGNDLSVEEWGIQQFPKEIAQRFRALQISLENIKRRFYKPGTEVRVTFFSTDLLFKNDVFPVMKKKQELEQAILYKYKEELKHLKNNEFHWNYYVVDEFEEQGVKKQRLQIVFSPAETINRYLYIFEHLKLPVSYLLPRPMSLILAYKYMVEEPKADLLINISYDFTQICYLKSGQLIYLRNLGLGSRNLEVTIKKDEPITPDIEEKIIGRKNEPNSQESILRKRLLAKLKDLKVKQNPVLHTFFSEILRSIAFIQGNNRQNYIDRIILTGYGILKESLIPYLKSRLNFPIFVMVPKLSNEEGDSILRYGEFTAVLGATLATKDGINLLPRKFQEKINLSKINKWVNFLIVLFFITSAYLTFIQYSLIQQKQLELSKLEQEYLVLNPFEESYKELLKLIGDVQKENQTLLEKIEEKPPVLEIMRLFSNLTPKAIRLNTLVFNKVRNEGELVNEDNSEELPKFTVNISGEITGDMVNGDVLLIDFINSLNNLKLFKDIKLDQKEKDVENKKIRFALTLTF